MLLKALIVDDEYPARKELRYLLEDYPEIQIIGEATNSIEALELINAVDYAVLFLDIDMPGFSGLELAKQIQNKDGKKPYIVFITAHEQFAINAFNVDAIDYLLKPINPERFAKAIDKIKEKVRTQEYLQEMPKAVTEEVKIGLIPVEYLGKTILLEEDNIVFVHASHDYVYLHTAKEKYLTRFTLKELESRLNSQIFQRCHRSYLVNIRKTKEVTPLYNGTLILTVADANKSEVPVSRSQAKRIRKILGL